MALNVYVAMNKGVHTMKLVTCIYNKSCNRLFIEIERVLFLKIVLYMTLLKGYDITISIKWNA